MNLPRKLKEGKGLRDVYLEKRCVKICCLYYAYSKRAKINQFYEAYMKLSQIGHIYGA